MRYGGEYEWAVYNPKGEPETSVSYKDLRTKFKTLVNPILGYDKSNKIIEIIDKLESIRDVNELTEISLFKEKISIHSMIPPPSTKGGDNCYIIDEILCF